MTDLDHVADLVSVTRPNGKVYTPRKPPAGVIVHDHHGDAGWIYILRTHDRVRARAIAEQIASREDLCIDEDETEGSLAWTHDGMNKGERFYFYNTGTGVPTVIFRLDT